MLVRKPLTDAFIQSLKPPVGGRTEVADIRSAGLSFRITSNGNRSWCFRFRDPQSAKTTRATVGPYPEISLFEARIKAEDWRRLVAGGQNPVTQKRLERDASAKRTFQALAERYIYEHARRHKRSASADERNLRLHVLPRWRHRRYDEIARADIIELIEGLITAGKPTLANRVQALVSSIFSFAMDAALVKGNPCAGLRRRGVEQVGRRVLSDHEIRLFWPGIMQKPVSRRVGLALRLVLLTGARPGEVAGLAHGELENIDDEDRARWVIPIARSKNGRSCLVPLCGLARQTVLSALALRHQEVEFVFPSPAVKDAPITAHALAVAMARFTGTLNPTCASAWIADPPTPHDLRRTLATRLAELGVAKEDRDAVLNHAPRDVGKKHYDLYEREPEKRRALGLWASTLDNIIREKSDD